MWWIVRAIFTIASIAYQNNKANAIKAKQEKAAEERKGFTFTTSGEASPVPVLYGKNYLGGNAVKHSVTNSYVAATSNDDLSFTESLANTSATGTKNEFLHVQYALCHEGIEGVVGVKVNNLDYNDAGQRFSHIIRTHNDGGTADAIATANGVPSTNTFTGTAFASATFKLDRDDPQYNGSPDMGFLLKGRKVRAVELNTGVYSLATSYVYSNNPALCLLDYLLNADFGRGLAVDEVDLESFYNSAVVCGTVGVAARNVSGVINGGPTTRDIPIYECNITLSSSNTIRDNIESIMNTMALAELTWSSEGKYKLLVEYPTSAVETDALVNAAHYFTDDEVIRDSVEITWPSASERYNQVTVNFLNEHEDFKSDSATWPSPLSALQQPELVTNGTFDGTGNVTGWALDGDAINNSGVGVFDVTSGAATNVLARQTIALTIGATYQLSFERLIGTDSCSISAAAAGLPTSYSSGVGVETRTFVATASSALFLINSGSGSAKAIVDNISVKDAEVVNAHATYLTEDNQQPFVGSFQVDGVTDPYHAQATAEQLVRESRQARTVVLTLSKKALSIEPGDFINLTLSNSGISDEVYRVEAIQVNSDFTVKTTCTFFDHEVLAWNVADNIAYATRPTFDFTVEPVTSLVYTAGKPSGDHTALAELTWTAPTDGSFKSVVYYTDGAGDLVILGETSSDNFFIYPRSDWTDGESVTFTVKAQTPLGRLSTGVAVTNTVVKTPATPTSFSATETLYQTNKASGVKARATLSFSEPVGGVEPKDYRVEYYRDEDGSTYELLGYTVGQTYVFNDIRAGNYHFKITPISWFDDEGTPLVGTKLILGLSAIPADPTGFSSKVTDSGILFTWNTPSDLDVVSGGTTEIRYVRNDVVTPKWEIAQTIVNNISGSTTTATLPIASGYYLIKHIDSSGNACAEPAQLLNSFVGPDFNAITTITEDPTFAGTKTNCTVIGHEKVTNGAFGTATDWTISNADAASGISGGQAYVLTAGANAQIAQTLALIEGRTYDISFNLVSEAGNGLAYLQLVGGTTQNIAVAAELATLGVNTFTFVAGNSSTLRFMTYGAVGQAFTIDDVSVTEAADPALELDAAATTMTYLFDNDIDLGSVENIRLVPNMTAVITDGVTVVADYDPVSAVTRFAGPIVDAAVNFEVRHTDDDPAGTPTWTDWETFSIGNYRARGFQFRLTGTVAAAAYTVIISELSLTADKADVYKRGTSASSAGTDTTVTFASDFYGGIGGTDLPHVGFSTIGGSAGDSINIVSITKSAFVYSVYNSGARVVRNISWQAIGQ